MGKLRTANKRHKRALLKLARPATTPTEKPVVSEKPAKAVN